MGKTLRFEGEIISNEDLCIDGMVSGTIKIPKSALLIGVSSTVHADVDAKSVTVEGQFKGKIKAAERLEIKKAGSVEGDVISARLVIEDGGLFRGTSEMPSPKATQQPAPSPPAAKPTPAAPAARVSSPAAVARTS